MSSGFSLKYKATPPHFEKIPNTSTGHRTYKGTAINNIPVSIHKINFLKGSSKVFEHSISNIFSMKKNLNMVDEYLQSKSPN